MKKLFAIIITIIFITSCSTTKETASSNAGDRNEKKLAEQADIMKAVESRRFIIKLDRIYLMNGGNVSLKPRANYIIIDGDKAIISAAYLGRQYDIKPIVGINMRGETSNYELTSKVSKGKFEIKTKILNHDNSFDLILSIGKNGSCNASLSSILIDNVSYQGYLEPLKVKPADKLQKEDVVLMQI